jgi:hypothetical protein
MLINTQPALADRQPLGGFGFGAFPCPGAGVGSLANQAAAKRPQPRNRRVGWTFGLNPQSVKQAGLASAAHQHNYIKTRISPVYGGVLGPHPAGEPEPV